MSDDPAFTPAELALFEALLACCDHYLEWGCGTSTAIAARRVRGSVTSIDSSAAWIDRVQRSIEAPLVTPRFVHVDIGPIGAFGYPVDEACRERWPKYSQIAAHTEQRPDLVLVDGRFRVACALRALASGATSVLVHDYANRPHYHTIGEYAHEIARADRLSLFVGEAVPPRYLLDPR